MLFIIYLSYIFLIWPLLEARAEYKNIFVGFLVQMKSLEFAFEINRPLEINKKELKGVCLYIHKSGGEKSVMTH